MLSPSNLRIFVSSQPADMRKSFDGLSCLCREFLGQDPTSGQVFVFFNRPPVSGNMTLRLIQTEGARWTGSDAHTTSTT